MPYEVELKFPIADRAAVREALLKLGAKPESTQAEVDTYFQHPARSFAQTDEALRVRQTGSRIFLTYKGPKIDAATKTRTEIELELLPGPSTSSDVIQVFEKLGFQPVRDVRKSRELLHVPWHGSVVKASLDQVPPLGDFVELELSSEPAQLDQSRQLLTSLAARLNLQASERRSYLELLLEKDARAAASPEGTENWSET